MATLCIAIFLFSYVNATMFWHGHSAAGYWYFHSHIAGETHRNAPVEKAHNSAELLLIQTLNQANFTEKVIPACDIVPFRTVREIIQTVPEQTSGFQPDGHIVLRGPPELV